MQQFYAASSFRDFPIEIFWYPSIRKSQEVLLLLKGIYALHVPNADSWDNDVIDRCNGTYNVVCINTARNRDQADLISRKESFVGKTFSQECDDISKAWNLIVGENLLPRDSKLHIVGLSFGGTSILGVDDLLRQAQSILMIGSGCGKSDETTKPLLSTLPDEKSLLLPLRSFRGNFAFLRGSEDAIVPKDSQEKIFNSAISAKICIVATVGDASHELIFGSKNSSLDRLRVISTLVDYLVSLS